jgi:hypothetical protein
MANRQNGKLTNWKADVLESWQNGKLTYKHHLFVFNTKIINLKDDLLTFIL